MKPAFIQGNVRVNCPYCNGAVTTYEFRSSTADYGQVVLTTSHIFAEVPCKEIVYKLLRCAGCGKGGIAEVHVPNHGSYLNGVFERFLPRTIESLSLPKDVPDGVSAEFKEAELCASIQAWRAASAMLRSTLEKTLEHNGYVKGTLAARIDAAAADGVITAARSRRAHEDIRVLGNDILHDEWRAVTEDEFELARRYAQRILEDLYDDRPSVEAILTAKGRLGSVAPPPATAAAAV